MGPVIWLGSLSALSLVMTSILALSVNRGAERGNAQTDPLTPISTAGKLQWDPNGYVIFCLCMGQLGNQIDQFIGGMAFAKGLNRTLVVPPLSRFISDVPFSEWFKIDPIRDYHRAVTAEDFMQHLAPSGWPPGERRAFCRPTAQNNETCDMKGGNPFRQFWEGLDVDFDSEHVYHLSISDHQHWAKEYPAEKFPVLAMKTAPAAFPVIAGNRKLQRHLMFSDRIEAEAQAYIDSHFPNQSFVGIHLRNGPDWEKACSAVEGRQYFMASAQCLENSGKLVKKTLCLPTKSEVLGLLEKVIIDTKAKVVFVATDKNPMIEDIKEQLNAYSVDVFHADPFLPVIDLAILGKSTHFIGNCVSSFSGFVKRARDLGNKTSSFWAFS